MRDKLDSLFKAYDIRGIYPNEIDEQLSFDIGYALSKYINDDTFVIGHDARLSSESLFNAFSSGIMSNGKNTLLMYSLRILCLRFMLVFSLTSSINDARS